MSFSITKGIRGLVSGGVRKSLGAPAPSWSFINGMWVPMVDNPDKYIREGFKANAYVFSIVNHIIDVASNAPGGVFKQVDAAKAEKFRLLRKSDDFMSILSARIAKSQAFDEVGDHPFMELMKRPNPLQSGKQFRRDLMGYYEICGNAYAYAATPGVGINANTVKQLWVIPSPCVTIETGTRSEPIRGYKVSYYGDELIPRNKIIHMKSFNPVVDYTGGEWLYGMSKMATLRSDLSEYKAAQTAQGTLFANMGPRGIISGNSDFGPDEETAIAIHDRFVQMHTGPMHGGGYMVTPADVKFTAIGMSPVDLNILAAKGDILQAICAVYRYPKELFTGAQNVSSQGENNRKFITSCVLPLLIDFDDVMTSFIQQAYNDPTLVYISDTQYFPELQPNRKELAEWLKLMEDKLKIDEIRAAMDYDELEDGLGNYVLVPSGKVKLQDVVSDVVDPDIDMLEGAGALDGNNQQEEDNATN